MRCDREIRKLTARISIVSGKNFKTIPIYIRKPLFFELGEHSSSNFTLAMLKNRDKQPLLSFGLNNADKS